jgi:diacylglycerol kinase (CTP)
MITFHSTPLSAENSKGVKNITRKVIKRLEGLGHLEMVEMNMSVPEEDDQLDEMERIGRSRRSFTLSARKLSRMRGPARQRMAMGMLIHKRPRNQNPPGDSAKSPTCFNRYVFNIYNRRLSRLPCQGFLTLYLYVLEGDVRTIVLVLWMALAVLFPPIQRLRSDIRKAALVLDARKRTGA